MADGTANTAAVDQETVRIEDALDQLITAAIAHAQRVREARTTPFDLRMWSTTQLMEDFDRRMAMSKVQRRADDLLDDPVGIALRVAVRRLGERLYEIGGTELMGDVCDRVAERDSSKEGWRIDIMDKRWDGIGTVGGKVGWTA